VNAAIAGLPNIRRKIPELWGSHDAPKRDGGQHVYNVAPIFKSNTAARWAQGAIYLCILWLFCFIDCSETADSIADAQMPMDGGRSYLPLDNIRSPPAEDMMNDNGAQSDDDGDTWHANSRSFPMTK
jgi:hypothetical protein